MEHDVSLVALLYLPIVLMAVLTVIHAGARVRLPGAKVFEDRYQKASTATKLAVLLMLMSATIHLALAPGHMCAHWSMRMLLTCPAEMPGMTMSGEVQEPYTAILFALDGLAFLAVSVLAFYVSRWRPLAVILLLATILTYAAYVASGREEPDVIGLATKLIELAAIALIVIPRSAACVLVTIAARKAVGRNLHLSQEVLK